jgi:hypothetical protein
MTAFAPEARACRACMIVSAVVIALNTTGCRDSDVIKRLDQSIADLEKAQPDSLLDPEKVLSQLKIATIQSLSQPTLCQSRLTWKTAEQNDLLLVSYWIENQPTVDAIRLEWSQEHVDCRILSMYAAENAKESEVGVVFTSVFHFPEESLKAFELLRSEGMPSLVLLRDGKPVSNRLTVQRNPVAGETPSGEDN